MKMEYSTRCAVEFGSNAEGQRQQRERERLCDCVFEREAAADGDGRTRLIDRQRF